MKLFSRQVELMQHVNKKITSSAVAFVWIQVVLVRVSSLDRLEDIDSIKRGMRFRHLR